SSTASSINKQSFHIRRIVCLLSLEIHHCPYTEGMLGFSRPEIALMGKKILIGVIKAILGPQQDIGKLANTDLVIHCASDPNQGLPDPGGKSFGVAIPLDSQHWLQDLHDFVTDVTSKATPMGIFGAVNRVVFSAIIEVETEIEWL